MNLACWAASNLTVAKALQLAAQAFSTATVTAAGAQLVC